MTRVLVLAKEPVAGRVKTRLCPPYTPEQAAALAEAALVDTLAAVAATPGARPLVVLDGRPGRWLPGGMAWTAQATGTFDERLAAAFELYPGQPALLIGMDTPQLTPALLEQAIAATAAGAAFGPAADGGWWALGLADARGDLLRGIETSTARTGALQRARLVAAGLSITDLPELVDVDTADEAEQVASTCPASSFAQALRAMSAEQMSAVQMSAKRMSAERRSAARRSAARRGAA